MCTDLQTLKLSKFRVRIVLHIGVGVANTKLQNRPPVEVGYLIYHFYKLLMVYKS